MVRHKRIIYNKTLKRRKRMGSIIGGGGAKEGLNHLGSIVNSKKSLSAEDMLKEIHDRLLTTQTQTLTNNNKENKPEDDINKKRAMMSAKRAKQMAISASTGLKSPVMHLMDYMLYTLYTMMSIFIYYPTYWVNLPNSTLEELIPTNEGCKTLVGDERLCKKKIKCLFSDCSLFEDPVGYKLDKKRERELNNGKKLRKSKKVQKIEMKGGKTLKKINNKKLKNINNINKKLKGVNKKTRDYLLKLYINEKTRENKFYRLLKKI
jgi:hypothetical protein